MPTGRATINNNRIYDYNGNNVVSGKAIGIKVNKGGLADILNNLIHDCYDTADNRNKNHRNRCLGITKWILNN